jgi:rhodanese-related sulfurtransferase
MLLGLALALAIQAQPLTVDSAALRIPFDEFKKLYDAGQVLVVDTRGEQSYRTGHIPGARLVPYHLVRQHIEALKKERRPIVTYCT